MIDYIEILNKFKEDPYEVIQNDKDMRKLIAAINRSIKLLQRYESRKKEVS